MSVRLFTEKTCMKRRIAAVRRGGARRGARPRRGTDRYAFRNKQVSVD